MSHDTKHDDRARNMAYLGLRYGLLYEKQLLVSMCRFQSALAINQAEKEGREFSPIFWYVDDNNQLIMTLWDMT